ncbi:hypothetical protein ACFRFH_14780 [Leifsonia sp. NPDC056824]|uniref:hypothetical protein n=1 Tax=Leifsonia sp. NPDC056824 TaxID=3345953 RepID=UPI00367487A7
MPVEVRDGFDTDGVTIPGWTMNRYNWRVQDGALTTFGDGGNRVITPTDIALADTFTVSTEIRSENRLRMWSGLAVHVSGSSQKMLSFRMALTESEPQWQFIDIAESRVYATGTLDSGFRADAPYRMSLASTGYGEYSFDLRDDAGSLPEWLWAAPSRPPSKSCRTRPSVRTVAWRSMFSRIRWTTDTCSGSGPKALPHAPGRCFVNGLPRSQAD